MIEELLLKGIKKIFSEDILAKKRYKKKQKRNKSKKEREPQKEPSNFQFRLLSKKYYSAFNKFIITDGFLIDSEVQKVTIEVPENFSFVKDFSGTSNFFKELNYYLYYTKVNISLNFEICKHISISSSTYLQILIIQYDRMEDRYNSSNYLKVDRRVETIRSNDTDVNKMLCSLRIITSMGDDDDIDDITYLPLGLKIFLKKRSNYQENKKGRTCNDIIDFVNNSIKGLDVELNLRATKSLQNLFSEILGNAEDHSRLNEYYVNGVSFKKNTSEDDSVVELNLSIINFGYSIYDGFVKTKHENIDVINKMEGFFHFHEQELSKIDDDKIKKENFTEESLYTLYALQEGISRLKYEDVSRGNGTMNFINAFMELGKFGEENPQFESKLNVISGHTVIECTNKYKPYVDGTNFVLSLNEEQQIKKLPDRNCIFVNEDYFPGTILQVKIHMNKKYFKKIIDNKNEQRD